jgi:glycosyltransferase involved in cell wall biosynthesis
LQIAYFCQYFVPETAAPAARVSELARAWADAGHKITVVTGLPNHPTGRIPQEYRATVFRRERLGAVDVWRNWLYATPNEGLVRKTMSHLSFMVSTLFLSVPRLRRADVLIVSSPTFFVVITVCLAHWLWRVPYIFEVRDLWPGVFVELGVIRNRWLIKVLEGLEMFLYRRAALVVVVTESFREVLVRRGLPPEQVAIITNGVDAETFRPDGAAALLNRAKHRIDSRFVVLYIGAHGISHALSSILEVAARFRDEADVSFVFVGDGAEKQRLVRQAHESGLSNVRFLPSQPRETLPAWYASADVVLVPLRDIPVFETFIPSKMFEILACERPIVASVRGEARRILERSGGAVVVDPEDVDGIAQAIRVLRADAGLRERLGRSGGTFARREYDRRVLAGRYLGLLEATCHPR